MDRAEYQKYLASREWALLKEKVRQRSENICERCKAGPHDVTHHLTYERIGREEPEDLIGVCEDCHKFLSGKSDHDPSEYRKAVISEGIARIRKAKALVDSARDLMSECFPDGDYEHTYYDLSESFFHLLSNLSRHLGEGKE